MVDRVTPYTDAELDAAVAAIADPARLTEAQDLVMRTAPALQRLLGIALEEGGWFGLGHEQAMREAMASEDPGDRLREVRTLLAEETRLGMLVGVAVGFELARELEGAPEGTESHGVTDGVTDGGRDGGTHGGREQTTKQED